MHKVYTNDVIEQIRTLYCDEGVSALAIANKLALGKTQVWRLIKRLGFIRKSDPKLEPSEELLDRVCALYQSGRSVPAISKDSDIPAHRIKKWLISRSVKIRSNSECQTIKSSTRDVGYDEIYDLYITQNKSQLEVGKTLGCSQKTIGNILTRFGIAIRTKAESQAGSRNFMFGRTHTPEAVAKIKEANRRQFENPEARRRHAELTCMQIVEGRTGKRNNKLELWVADFLETGGYEYRRQHKLGTYVYDFYIPSLNLLLESHGTFWHADPRFYDRYTLTPIQKRNLVNDEMKQQFALDSGYRFELIWEYDVAVQRGEIKYSERIEDSRKNTQYGYCPSRGLSICDFDYDWRTAI